MVSDSIATHSDRRLISGAAPTKLQKKLDRLKLSGHKNCLRDVQVNTAIYNKLPTFTGDGKFRSIHSLISKYM